MSIQNPPTPWLHQKHSSVVPCIVSISTTELKRDDASSSSSIINRRAIHMLQTISIQESNYTFFYDTGCMGFITRFHAASWGSSKTDFNASRFSWRRRMYHQRLKPWSIQRVRLSISLERDATLTGVCLEEITSTFPLYQYVGQVCSM